MMRLESDLASHCLAACEGRLLSETVTWSSDATIGVVLASEHYPLPALLGCQLQVLVLSRKALRFSTLERRLPMTQRSPQVDACSALPREALR